eukprot:3547902-Prymnesium_polylepis.1
MDPCGCAPCVTHALRPASGSTRARCRASSSGWSTYSPSRTPASAAATAARSARAAPSAYHLSLIHI